MRSIFRYILFLCLICQFGCTSNSFYSHLNGTQIIAGIKDPTNSSGISFVEYLSGEKIAVKDYANIHFSYTNSVKNKYFGLLEFDEFRSGTVNISTNNMEIYK